jgi:hypothetical protein
MRFRMPSTDREVTVSLPGGLPKRRTRLSRCRSRQPEQVSGHRRDAEADDEAAEVEAAEVSEGND